MPDLLRAFALDSGRFGALYAAATLASGGLGLGYSAHEVLVADGERVARVDVVSQEAFRGMSRTGWRTCPSSTWDA